jgi:hypothetical protein
LTRRRLVDVVRRFYAVLRKRTSFRKRTVVYGFRVHSDAVIPPLPDWHRFVVEWVSLYPSQLRHKLGTRRFASASPDWWRSFDFAKFADLLDLRLGVEVAAETGRSQKGEGRRHERIPRNTGRQRWNPRQKEGT